MFYPNKLNLRLSNNESTISNPKSRWQKYIFGFGVAIVLSATATRDLFVFFSENSNDLETFQNALKPNPTINHVKTARSNIDNDKQYPKIAWLMSFPNSGTSYTLKLVNMVSNRSIASNYNEGSLDEWGNNVPIHANYTNGPWRHQLYLDLPDKYILTKTHCKRDIIMTSESFQKGCCIGRRAVPTKDMNKGEEVQYDINPVKKAVHLFRDPFDNIISRFHLHIHRQIRKNNTAWPKTKKGFRLYCADMNSKMKKKELEFYGEMIATTAKVIPCHMEFYKYIEWHNRAVNLTRAVGIPTHILHYEDYRDYFNGTVSKLLDFLELPSVNKAPEYLRSEYSNYYTSAERSAAIAWMKRLASEETLKQLKQHYFH